MSATESRTGSLGTWTTALARERGCDRASASDSRVPVTRSGSALEAVRQWPERTAIALHTFTSCKDESTELARKSDPVAAPATAWTICDRLRNFMHR